ncbi:MAG: chemotaxis protein CheD [Firmicutes bacterium]|jgi:chemotaxis protein CheD|nr:chemotaxis protein CheD [Bacillota bacterium]
MEPRVLPVGIGEIRFSDEAGSVLVTYSLGSCIGLTAYDPVLRLGGMAHIVLPNGTAGGEGPGKYAHTSVPALVRGLLRMGAARERIVIKMAGGARILGLAGTPNGPGIGSQNQAAVLEAVGRLGLRVHSADCGGTFGRTMRLFLDSGVVEIVTATRGSWTI